MLRVLVARGLDVDAVDSYGNTPLHYAARLGRADLIATLIEAGAGVNAIHREGVSPSRQALLSVPRSHEAVERLIAAGADLEQRNGDGLSVRDFARATAGGDPELFALFDFD
jgi:ankyrin repeat protein